MTPETIATIREVLEDAAETRGYEVSVAHQTLDRLSDRINRSTEIGDIRRMQNTFDEKQSELDNVVVRHLRASAALEEFNSNYPKE